MHLLSGDKNQLVTMINEVINEGQALAGRTCDVRPGFGLLFPNLNLLRFFHKQNCVFVFKLVFCTH